MPETFSAREAPRKGSSERPPSPEVVRKNRPLSLREKRAVPAEGYRKGTRPVADLPDLELDPTGALSFKGAAPPDEGPEITPGEDVEVSLDEDTADEPIELNELDIEDVSPPPIPLAAKRRKETPRSLALPLRRVSQAEDALRRESLRSAIEEVNVHEFSSDPEIRRAHQEAATAKVAVLRHQLTEARQELSLRDMELRHAERLQKLDGDALEKYQVAKETQEQKTLSLENRLKQAAADAKILQQPPEIILRKYVRGATGAQTGLRPVLTEVLRSKLKESEEMQKAAEARQAERNLFRLEEATRYSSTPVQKAETETRIEYGSLAGALPPLVRELVAEKQAQIKTYSRKIERLQEEYTKRYGGDIVRAESGEEQALEGLKRIAKQVGGFFKSMFAPSAKKEDSRTEMIQKYRQALDDMAVAEDTIKELTVDGQAAKSSRTALSLKSASRTFGPEAALSFDDWGGRESTRRELERREQEEGGENARRFQARVEHRVGIGKATTEDLEDAFEGQRIDDENTNMRAWQTMLLAGRTPDNQSLNAKTLEDIRTATNKKDEGIRSLPKSDQRDMLDAVVKLDLKELRTKLPKHAQAIVENWQKVTAKKVSSLSTALNRPATSQEHIKTQHILDRFMEIFDEDTPEAAITSYKLSMEALANLPHHRSISEKLRAKIVYDYTTQLDSAHKALGMSIADRENFLHDMRIAGAAESSGRTSTRKAA